MRLRTLRNVAWPAICIAIVLSGCGPAADSDSARAPEPSVAQGPSPQTDLAPNSFVETTSTAPAVRPRPTLSLEPAVGGPSAGRTLSTRSDAHPTKQDDWPRFRGPDGCGVSNATGLPLKWSGAENIAWKTELPGPGSSSPIVFEDHVYLTCYTGYGLSIESAADPADLQRHLVCLDRNRGNVLWTASMPSGADVAPYTDPISIGRHGYASSTPTADASGVYVFYGSTGAAAYSHEGELRWHVSCGDQTHVYGSASSPVLYDDLLIVHAEIESNSLIALDKASGREVWRQPKTQGKGNTWSTPNLFEVDGRSELVFVSGYGKVAAADPRSGARLWEFDAGIRRINPTVVRGSGLYFALGGPNGRSVGLSVERNGGPSRVEKKWELNKSSYITSPVHHDGHLYWAHEGASIAYCVNARTGELIYERRFDPVSGDILASPVVADGRIYYVSRGGGTFVISARPEFELLAHNVIETDGSMFNGSPAVSGSQIFLRSDRFIYCIGEEAQVRAQRLSPLTAGSRPLSRREDSDRARGGAFASDDAPASASHDERSEAPGLRPEADEVAVAAGSRSGNPRRRRAAVGEWPGFRGPGGLGVSGAVGLPTEWSATRNLVWKRELPGPGASSPIAWGDRIYITCYSGYGLDPENPGDKSQLKRHLVCIDGESGRILWHRAVPASGAEKPYRDMALQLHGYASQTPAADESGVYVFYGPSGAAAYTHSGRLRWHTPCGETTHNWGTSPSVVLSDALVILNAAIESNALIALEKRTGNEAWRINGLASAFHTPLLTRVDDHWELVVAHDQGHLVGIDPARGQRLWMCRAFVDHVNSSPVAHGGVVFLAGRGHLAAVRAGGRAMLSQTRKLWELDKGSYVPSPVYYRGHVYWAKEDGGIVYCANAATGELVYQKRLQPESGRIYASPIVADGKLYYVSREQGTYVLTAAPEYRILAYNTIGDDASVFNGSPAVHRGRLLLRSDRFLYCIDEQR